MANTLGTLIVRLGLDAAEFTSGLSRSEYEAQKFAKKLEQGLATAGRAVGIAIAGIGAAAAGAFVVLQREIDNVAGFKQLSEQIGDTAEAFSGLRTASATSGVDMNEIAEASIKLTKALSKTDDESKGAAQAIKAIGINFDEFLKLSPVAKLEEIAQALAKFDDGEGKTAFAEALVKGGAKLLPFLNDLADAGGRNVKLAQEQIELADQYAKQQARVRAELQDLIRVVAVESLPAFIAFTGAVTDTAKAILGLDKAASDLKQSEIGEWAKATAIGVGYVVDAVHGASAAFIVFGKSLGGFLAAHAALKSGDFGGVLRIFAETVREVEATYRSLDTSFADRFAARLAAPLPAARAPRPQLDPRAFSAGSGGGAAKGADEFARALENVAKSTAVAQAELDALMAGTGELTQAQKALVQLRSDKAWQAFTEGERDLITVWFEQYDAILRTIDAEKKRREEFDKSIEAMQRQAESEAKARDSVRQSVKDYELQNEIMRRQIAIIGQDQVAREKLIATIEKERLVSDAKKAGDIGAIADYEKLYQARLKLIDSADAANKALDEQQKMKRFVDDLGAAFASAAEDAIVFGKSAKDVLKGLEQDLLRIVTRKLVTEPLANAISGLLGGSTGQGGIIGSLLSMFGSTGSSLGGNLSAPGFANGTNFAPGGLALVGERGPEIVHLPRGSQVTPNSEARHIRTGPAVVQYITNLPGVTRQSAHQSASESSRRLQQAYVRNA